MTILPARILVLLASLALSAACVAPRSAPPVDVRARFETPGLPPVDVRFSIQPEHRRAEQRYLGAAMATLKNHGEWLGPFPRSSLTILDPPWGGSPSAITDDTVVLERTPWWSTASSMTPELATARGVSHRFLTAVVDTAALPPWFVDGLSEYAARRVVTWLFEQENLPPGYAFVEMRHVHRFVPLALRIRLLPATDGDPIPAYRAHATASATPAAADERSLEAKTILALGTLERWVGKPVFDQLIAEFVRQSRSSRPTLADFARIAGEVSGQDLTWFFSETFDASRVFDYGVQQVTSDAGGSGVRYRTTVVVRRFGDAVFSGTSRPRVGLYQSGRGIEVLIEFADGTARREYWDGRDRWTSFVYDSAEPVSRVSVDPQRTLLLDVTTTNNTWTRAPQAASASTNWAGRWMTWLQDLLLDYASFV